MAALFDQYPNPLVDLRDVASAQLEPLLYEETEEWRTELNWDYRPSADLVRRFVDMRALTGFTLPGEKEIAGYGYYVCEDGKGLIGGLYVGRRYRTIENENTLLNAILDSMWRTPGTRRVEAQLMMLSSPLNRSMPNPRWFRAFPRKFFEVSAGRDPVPAPARAQGRHRALVGKPPGRCRAVDCGGLHGPHG